MNLDDDYEEDLGSEKTFSPASLKEKISCADEQMLDFEEISTSSEKSGSVISGEGKIFLNFQIIVG